MSFDGITLKSVIGELNSSILGGKINKVFEPSKNEIIFSIYSNGNNYALDAIISADNYRVNLTTHSKPNPINAPSFCMLLRKHLIGSKIRKIYSNGLERILIFELECYNELNDLIRKKLIIELMGKHSNIILVNENNRIIDSLRHLDTYSKSYRNILPAHEYVLPAQDKEDFYLLKDENEFYLTISTKDYSSLTDAISNTFNGISKTFIKSSLSKLEIDDLITIENSSKIYKYIKEILNNIGSSNIIISHFSNDYSVTIADENEDYLQINFFLDDYYTQKENNNIFNEYRLNLSKLVLLTLKKVTKKLANINQKLKDCENMDKYKLYGELIIANLYQIDNKANLESITLENYYNKNLPINIPLDKKFSISDNAKNFYKKYNKLKNALKVVSEQKIETEKEINYIESIIFELEGAKSIEDVDEIYNEISESGIFENIKKKSNRNISSKVSNKKYVDSIKPLTFEIDGHLVLVGKNNKQNDYLTTKFAKKDDIWFHTKDIHGSHVILKTNGSEISITTLEKCARLAAHYSKGKLSSNVPVDYAFVKNVKKPSGSKPGMVIYTNNKTLYVDPKLDF